MTRTARNDAANGLPLRLREFLARLLELKKSAGASYRELEDRIPYSKSTIQAKLKGGSDIDWPFVSLFVIACADIVGREPDL